MISGSNKVLNVPPVATYPEDLVDMTAMVDIVFFMLIFFMITSTQPVEAMMDMPPPKAEGSAAATQAVDQGAHEDFIQVRIEDDDSIWVDDAQAFSEVDLRIRLKQARDDGEHGEGVFVMGDADASHGAAVKVFDACADSNLPNVLFSVQDKVAE
ncbi:MAG: biopolymer transporter ExbD [Pirellulaceae bacterium]|nr:biopolymer transporter ExbD [Pirellulaceae bacterium]